MSDGAVQNTDRELWRERPGDYYSDSIHVTEDGRIGIDVGGHVLVMPLRAWHDAGMKEHKHREAMLNRKADEIERLEDMDDLEE